MRKINEIFYSLQGEGFYTGTPAVFVRFSGCNLKCSFCDTQHEDGRMMSDDEIVAEVCKYPCRMVILTGGEPGLWIDSILIATLHAAGKYIAIGLMALVSCRRVLTGLLVRQRKELYLKCSEWTK